MAKKKTITVFVDDHGSKYCQDCCLIEIEKCPLDHPHPGQRCRLNLKKFEEEVECDGCGGMIRRCLLESCRCGVCQALINNMKD